jgi:hypothetical protein
LAPQLKRNPLGSSINETRMTAPPPLKRAPWRDIWIHPRRTVRELVAAGPNHAALLFPVAWGVVQSLFQGAQNNVGARAPVALIVVMTFAIGSVWGLLQVHVLSGLVYLVGRWTGAKADYYPVRTAVAWGTLPAAASLVLWMLGTLAFGRALFLNDQSLAATRRPDLLIGIGLIYLTTAALWLWSAVIIVGGIAEVQGGSIWRAVGTIVVGLVMFAVVVVLVVTVFMMVS